MNKFKCFGKSAAKIKNEMKPGLLRSTAFLPESIINILFKAGFLVLPVLKQRTSILQKRPSRAAMGNGFTVTGNAPVLTGFLIRPVQS
jgi:hypothetical protein